MGTIPRHFLGKTVFDFFKILKLEFCKSWKTRVFQILCILQLLICAFLLRGWGLVKCPFDESFKCLFLRKFLLLLFILLREEMATLEMFVSHTLCCVLCLLLTIEVIGQLLGLVVWLEHLLRSPVVDGLGESGLWRFLPRLLSDIG